MQTLVAINEWLSADQIARDHLSDSQWAWLSHRGSLTQKLREMHSQKIHLDLKSEAWQLPQKEEAKLLGIEPGEPTLIREINWLFHNKPWIKARVIIPKSSTLGPGHELTKIGCRSLGDILFLDPHLKRSEFLFCDQEEYFSRRSIFHYYGKPILVQEDFLIENF